LLEEEVGQAMLVVLKMVEMLGILLDQLVVKRVVMVLALLVQVGQLHPVELQVFVLYLGMLGLQGPSE